MTLPQNTQMVPIDYAKALNQEQLDVVLHGDGPCLVLAGAGSGKTRTLTYRVAYLIEKGVLPEEILLLTFTNKAAREMIERVEGVLGDRARGIWGGTFHSIGSRFLRMYAEVLGYNRSFSILDADDAKDLIKAVMKDANIDTKDKRFPSKNVVSDIISYARNTQKPFAEVVEMKHPHFLHCLKQLEEIAEQYHLRKREANVMDFDDLLTNVAGLLEDPIRGERLSERFKYVLVDEYQDTNTVQARIVKAISRVHANVIAVGDDAQSIYGFRGADVKNILAFPKIWNGAKTFKLLTNYRSTPEILDLANASLEHNVDQFQKDLTALKDHGAKPVLVSCSSANQEAKHIADEILKQRKQGTDLANIAVLFRSSAHSQTLEFELIRRDIPYEYRGGQKFFERAHIKDVLCFLRVINNPKDEVAWLRILGLQVGIGATTAATLVQQLKTFDTVTDALLPGAPIRVPSRGKSGFDELVTILKEVQSQVLLPSVLIRTVTSSTYQDYLEREYPNYRERLEDLEQLASFAESYETLDAFLADIALYDEVVATREQAQRPNEERMILSTIHQAKGLEWDTVFIIHLTDQSFPSARALSSEEGIEEERRLFYVAVTRARRMLYLTYPMTMGYDALSFCQPSTFLEEVSSRLFDKRELREGRFAAGPRSSTAFTDSYDEGDGFAEDDVIQLDGFGEKRPSWRAKPSKESQATTTLWKKKDSSPEKTPSKSFLRSIEDL